MAREKMNKLLLPAVIDQLKKQKGIELNPKHIQNAWVVDEDENKSSNAIDLINGNSLAFRHNKKTWEIETIAFYNQSNIDWDDKGNTDASFFIL
jgi:hypothetical protein